MLVERDQFQLQEFAESVLHCQRCRAQDCDESHPVRPLNPTVSLVLPAMNEADNLPWVLGRIPSTIDQIVLVDGNSTDGTVETARRLMPGIEVMRQEHIGKGDALLAGLLAAKCDIVIVMDVDGSMDPAEIPMFVGCLLAGADVAKGSRCLAGGGSDDNTLIRRLGNFGLSKVASILYRGRNTDINYGYAAFWRDNLEHLGLEELADQPVRPPGRIWKGPAYGHGFELDAMLLCRAVRAQLRVSEVSCHEYRRRSGTSNLLSFRDGARVLLALGKELRWQRAS